MNAIKKAILFTGLMILALSINAQKIKSVEDSIKLKKAVSLEKGTRFATLTFSFSTRNANNNETLLTSVINQNRHAFDIEAGGGYFFKKYLAAGMIAGYNEVKNQRLLLNSDGSETQNNAFESGFTLAPFLDYYIPIDSKQRFYIFSRVELKYRHNSGVVESTTSNVLTRTFTESNGLGIGLVPGIMVFVVDRFAVSTSVGILGFNYNNSITRQTDRPEGRVTTTDFDLRINILQLNLGFAVYF
jgi:hypothetical protein